MAAAAKKPVLMAVAPVPVAPVAPVFLAVAAPVDAPNDLVSVDPTVWGPLLWRFLHIMAEYSGSPGHMSLWHTLVKAMRSGIPCEECREHFQAREKAFPLRIQHFMGGIHSSIVRWVLALHNFVAKATADADGREVRGWTESDCVREYGGMNRLIRMQEARAALDGLRGVAGEELIAAADRLMASVGR